jgi:D-glycero-alpha-D-manno-heptose-7-phosphate kinase
MKKNCARAPVRVDPAGAGTDAPPFSVEHGGLVVNMAVQRYAFASVDRLPPGDGIIISSLDLRSSVTAESADALGGKDLEFLQAFVRRLVPSTESMLLVTESDAPPGAGLGGSGALGVAVVAAIDRAYGRVRSALETAAIANEIERKDLGYPGGSQDSYGAALGGINRLEYVKGGEMIAHKIDIAEDLRLTLEHSALLIYTSEAHVSGNIHQDILESYAVADSPVVDAMTHLREAARKMAQALEAGELAGFVSAMNESCTNLYRLHPSCDCEGHRRCMRQLGDLIAAGKTCGAGGGGFLLVYAKPGCRRECIREAERMGALVWPVNIDFAGVTSWSAEPTPTEDIERYRQG